MIPVKLHAVLDYLVGLLLIAAPWIFQFSQVMPATILTVAMGIVTICYSLLTGYELSVLPIIPFRTHLLIDFISGLVLLFSPWIFQFNGQVHKPFLVIGIVEMVVVLLSKRPGRTRNN